MGFCPGCGGSAPLVEVPSGTARSAVPRAARVLPLTAVGPEDAVRRRTGIDEVDRVLGGGLVPGATVLVGGEPGVGKSTLLLQVAGALAAAGGTALVASAEESAAQGSVHPIIARGPSRVERWQRRKQPGTGLRRCREMPGVPAGWPAAAAACQV